ncbi:hypothetical protein OKW18_000145 [Streptomyces pratensis]|nr:hypothetical protein [Streptomyces pratensis]
MSLVDRLRSPHAPLRRLARMLIAAAWHQVLGRSPIGFAFTPLAKAALKDRDAFTRLLDPHTTGWLLISGRVPMRPARGGVHADHAPADLAIGV